MNRWQRGALVVVAAGAFWLGRAEAKCAADFYSVQMKLAATTPKDDSWPATVELTQLDDTMIGWTPTASGEQTVSLVAELR